ncbi:hypothetical protein NDU88_005404 [Pleurodeles waltl]|uniref:Uncharacterized protein n=1 Tax=Pleurodeles waltl TaxID=8319 RepID=A0AAV7VLE6_PLEWA|nr:hypothetical protein NDU88_005404 [Pleurodeles waltl]
MGSRLGQARSGLLAGASKVPPDGSTSSPTCEYRGSEGTMSSPAPLSSAAISGLARQSTQLGPVQALQHRQQASKEATQAGPGLRSAPGELLTYVPTAPRVSPPPGLHGLPSSSSHVGAQPQERPGARSPPAPHTSLCVAQPPAACTAQQAQARTASAQGP